MSDQSPPPPFPEPPPSPSSGAPYPASAYQSYGSTGSTGSYGSTGYAPPGHAALSLKGLTVALTVLFIVVAIAALIGSIAGFNRASVMSDLPNRLFTSDVQDADDAVGASGGLFALVALALAVVFIIWQYRHAKNAERLSGPLSLGPGWAIGGWFIPVGNFVLPQLQLYRAAAASDPDAPSRSGRAPSIVVAWWALYVGGSVLVAIGRFMHPSDDDVNVFNLRDKADQFATADRIMAIGLLVMIAAAVAGLLMVRQLSERQATALSRPQGQPPYQQPPQPYAQPQAYGQPQPPPQYPPPPTSPPPGTTSF